MGLEPKGRAFYWPTPSGSNGRFLKHDGDLVLKPRALRTARAISPKPLQSATMRGRLKAPTRPRNTPPRLRMTLEDSNDPGRDSRAGTSRPALGGRGHSGAPEECRAAG